MATIYGKEVPALSRMLVPEKVGCPESTAALPTANNPSALLMALARNDPVTESLAKGEVVATPTLPEESMRILSELFVENVKAVLAELVMLNCPESEMMFPDKS